MHVSLANERGSAGRGAGRRSSRSSLCACAACLLVAAAAACPRTPAALPCLSRRYDLFCRTIPTIQILLCGDESALELYAAKVGGAPRVCGGSRGVVTGCCVPFRAPLLTAVSPTTRPLLLQVAQGYRPPLPDSLPPSVAAVIEACWKGDPDLRPTAGKVVEMLQAIQASGGRAWKGRHQRPWLGEASTAVGARPSGRASPHLRSGIPAAPPPHACRRRRLQGAA